MLNWQIGKKRIFVKIIAFIMIQVFFVTSLGYSAESFSNKNLRIPMGLEKERFEAALASRVQPAQSVIKRLFVSHNSKKSEGLIDRFLASNKPWDLIMFIAYFAIFTLKGSEKGFGDSGETIAFFTGVVVASYLAAFLTFGMLAFIWITREPIKSFLARPVKIIKAIFMPKRYVLFDGIGVKENIKAFLEIQKQLMRRNPNTILIIITNDPEIKRKLEKYHLAISKRLIVRLLSEEQYHKFKTNLQDNNASERIGAFRIIRSNTAQELDGVQKSVLGSARISSQAL